MFIVRRENNTKSNQIHKPTKVSSQKLRLGQGEKSRKEWAISSTSDN